MMNKLYILQVIDPNGDHEAVILFDHEPDSDERKEWLRGGQTVDQVLCCDVEIGSASSLPLERQLSACPPVPLLG